MGFWIGFKRAFFARAQFIAQAKPAGEHDAEVGQRRPTRLRWTATGHVSVAESPLELPLQMNEIEILFLDARLQKAPDLPPFQTWALSGRLRIFCRKHARRKQARQGMRALSVFSYLFLLMRVTVVIIPARKESALFFRTSGAPRRRRHASNSSDRTSWDVVWAWAARTA